MEYGYSQYRLQTSHQNWSSITYYKREKAQQIYYYLDEYFWWTISSKSSPYYKLHIRKQHYQLSLIWHIL